ncbi:MAG: hypothetical protein J1E01_12375 [Acetatifactor sp.]|nr:hypothetical protein [Acetatifactor sp.]
MRKNIKMCLVIALCFIMSACGQGNANQLEDLDSSGNPGRDSIDPASTRLLEKSDVDDADPSDAGMSDGLGLISSVPAKIDATVLKEPPELVVSTINNADSVIASCGNYMWSREMPDGSMASTIACGAHPLDEVNQRATLYTAFPAGSLPALPEGQMPGMLLSVFCLDFGDVPPETVSVHRWPSTYIGHASEYAGDSEDVTVDMSDGFTILPLGDGEFVYEVHADWGEVGSADYVFNTVPQVRGAN